MNRLWLMSVATVVIGAAAFFAGPQIWPMGPDIPMPPANLFPAYLALSALEALAFGFAVAFAAFGWPAIRRLPLGAGWLNKLLFVTLFWFMGNWWIHDNLHMHIGLDMSRLLYIEYGFHISMLICAVTLTLSCLRLAGQAPTEKSS
jgi:hypothetical protein